MFLMSLSLLLQLWQQISGGSTQLFSAESWHKDVKGQNDKQCNHFKAGGDGHVEEKECEGNNAIAVCGGKSVKIKQISYHMDLT